MVCQSVIFKEETEACLSQRSQSMGGNINTLFSQGTENGWSLGKSQKRTLVIRQAPFDFAQGWHGRQRARSFGERQSTKNKHVHFFAK